jgi:protein-L-isoaspartate O-methyltransferase/radical SAM superfamily enzyme YgiQ (UPF0313 family)
LSRVLLVWPGGLFTGGANFGVPQLLSIAAALERGTGAVVDVVDLDMERAFGPIDLKKLLAPGYDVIGLSCYSSYDLLKVLAIGQEIERLSPQSVLVAGGYHASARPEDLVGEDSPFRYVVVGDGEGPMVRLVGRLAAGKRPLSAIVAAEPFRDSTEYDWSKLARYRPVARRVASQAEIYLSRGCPFDCAFCMERAKREVSWRPLEAERAVEEIHRLDQFLDLRGWTLFIADALFGMKSTWRKTFLEGLARRPSRAKKIWLLIRVDLVDEDDLALMARANVAPGFGLESGDPEQLARIRKSGRLDRYLDHMRDVASWARDLDVPFGANVIIGHPGETEATMRRSARYLEELFLGDARGTTGFLSVDSFRLYPGSPIDEDRQGWVERTGMRVHRYPWWHDGDQDFLAEWVDPSHELDYRRALSLRRELFDPILRKIGSRFRYQGPARGYFQRAIEEQVRATEPRQYLRQLGLYHLWQRLLGRPSSLDGDLELAALAREARAATLHQAGIAADDRMGRALVSVPRERFVAPEDLAESAADRPLALDNHGAATISALHAYHDAFAALALAEGDDYAELGAGSGYGATLAAEVVGERGRVRAIEIDAALVERARPRVGPRVELIAGDAHDVATWRGAKKIYVSFALTEIPEAFLAALAPGARLVAPQGDDAAQELIVWERRGDVVTSTGLGRVAYVRDRSPAAHKASR